MMLLLKKLTVVIAEKIVVQDCSLEITKGSVHAIMGQNGSGKSSLAHSLMGLSLYQIQEGQIEFEGQDLIQLSIHQRNKAGIFLAFQQPVTIPGVSVFQFLQEIYKASGQEQVASADFLELLQKLLFKVGLDQSFLYRSLHENFSGGEKKRLEILQMLLLKPKLIILDEIDSGLDVDALKSIAASVCDYLAENKDASCLVITHYCRILDYLEPDFVHVMHKGTIVESGSKDLAFIIEQQGYDRYDR